jgi:hypothetical protein
MARLRRNVPIARATGKSGNRFYVRSHSNEYRAHDLTPKPLTPAGPEGMLADDAEVVG